MSAEERAAMFTCPTKCAATHPGREHEHDPRCYQRTGVPADLPADTCDCGVWGLFRPATPDAGDASEVEALAEVALLSLALRQAARDHLGLDEGEHWPSGVAVAQSRAILASDWLAAREAAARAEGEVAALNGAADAWDELTEGPRRILGNWLRDRADRIARGDS